MLATLCLVGLSFPTLWAQMLISCSYKNLCQKALLSGNDVVLRCDHGHTQWHFTSILGDELFLFNSVPNIETLPGGSLKLVNPQPSQTGLYRCQKNDNTRIVEYEIDFQDVKNLHITHTGLDQKPLPNETLNLGGMVLVFTQWDPWQDCNRCGVPGERKRLGYCYVEEPPEEPLACGLYLREEEMLHSRLRPELQLEACLVPCEHDKEIHQPFFIFDTYQLGKSTSNMWITCPLASIYRPVNWEANSIPLTWHDQLSGQDFSYFLDQSTGGKQLKIFWQATYKCFVEQELMVQFNPEARPEMLEAQRMAMLEAQGAGEVTARSGKADSVLKQLMLMLLVVTTLALVGLLFKVLCPAQGKRSNQILLVK